MYNISRKNRRHIDYRVRAVRHCDDIKDVALKIKAKAQELISQFKSMKNGQKVALVLTKLIKYISGIYAAKTAYDLKQNINLINDWKKYALKTTASWETYDQESASADELKKKLMLKMGIKALIGLVVALVAQVKEKTIKAGLPSDYNEENYPNG